MFMQNPRTDRHSVKMRVSKLQCLISLFPTLLTHFYLDWEMTVILHRRMKMMKHNIPPAASNIFPLSTVLEKLHTIRITGHALSFDNHLLSEDSVSFSPMRML